MIDYLLAESTANDWTLTIADADLQQVLEKTKHSPLAAAVGIDITNYLQRSELVEQADLVISMMPPALHYLLAADCVKFGKHLLTASYLDPAIKALQSKIEDKKILFLCEMGLDPGIDHMSAMKILDTIRLAGGKVTSFKSHCGGLIAPESDDNPWHYKISWNPRNVVLAGKAGATYKRDGLVHQQPYQELFQRCAEIRVDGLPSLAIYPNRDSLTYLPLYVLEDVQTFVRTTIRYPEYCAGWDAIIQAGLTDDQALLPGEISTIKEWATPILPFVTAANKPLLEFLDLFSDQMLPSNLKTSADVLQWLLETRLVMKATDKDMIVMLHEIEYVSAGETRKIESSLVVRGEDHLRTAMAKTVGLPLGIAAKLILNGTITLTGVHIPILQEIYEPVLAELEAAGICFSEKNILKSSLSNS